MALFSRPCQVDIFLDHDKLNNLMWLPFIFQGWTADDYEIGGKGKAAELEKPSLKEDTGEKTGVYAGKGKDVSYKLSKDHESTERREQIETDVSSKANSSNDHGNSGGKATGDSNTLSPQARTSGLAKAATAVTVSTVSN